jgi:peptidoglycan hydrolase-like protein with peptidoglycan-binding domain
MTTVTRQDFTRLSRNGGQIDLDRMPANLRETFRQNGISDADLRAIAGQDRVIRGEAEFGRLFDRLDGIDTDGRSGTIATTDRAGAATASGRVFEAVQREVEASRARTAREGGARFAGNSELQDVAQGRRTLELGARGDSVRLVQQALLDVGALPEDHGVTGHYDQATADAVRRFQRETGVGVDGNIGADTLSALSAAAPPAGQRIDRSAEYDRLYADGRLDVTMAVGFDEGRAHEGTERGILSGLRAQGYTALDPSRMSQAERDRYGLTADRYDPNARYFARTHHDDRLNRDVTTVVRMITPGTDGARARASFEQAMRQDEVVMYNGHARYGTGPDFDVNTSGRGNYVIDEHGNRRHETPPAGLRSAIRGRGTDLSSTSQRPDYQVLIFNGCNTEEYLHNLRNPGVSGRSMTDTDVIATQTGPRYMWTGDPAMRFLRGLTSREGNSSMFRDQARMEQSYLRRVGLDGEVAAGGHTFVESGFLGNAQNRRVSAP